MKSLKATYFIVALTILSSCFWSLSPYAEELDTPDDINNGEDDRSKLRPRQTEASPAPIFNESHIAIEIVDDQNESKTLVRHAKDEVVDKQNHTLLGNSTITPLVEHNTPASVADTNTNDTFIIEALHHETVSEEEISTKITTSANSDISNEQSESSQLTPDSEQGSENQKEIEKEAQFAAESIDDVEVDQSDLQSQEMTGRITREAGPTDEIVSEDQPDSAQKLYSPGTPTTTKTDETVETDEDVVSTPEAGVNSTKSSGDMTEAVDTTISNEGGAGPVGEEEDDDDDDDEDIRVRAVNYAHKNAGAIILYSSPTFKGTSNLLVSDNDRYAIAPCSDKKTLVLSLSEDILVKVIVLSNFEKYSSSVKEFQVLGSQNYDPGTSKTKWHDLGKYVAQPTSSGEEIFELKEPSWARYLKFRFMTHYGNEHYCTITQIKVHGSTMVQGFHEQYDPWPGVEGDLEDVLDNSSSEVSENNGDAIDNTSSPSAEEAQISTSEEDFVVDQKGTSTLSDVSPDNAAKEEEVVSENSDNDSQDKSPSTKNERESKDANGGTDEVADDDTEETRKTVSEQASPQKASENEMRDDEKIASPDENHTSTKITEAVLAVTSILDTVSSMVTTSVENRTSGHSSNETITGERISSIPDDADETSQKQANSSIAAGKEAMDKSKTNSHADSVKNAEVNENASESAKEASSGSADNGKPTPTNKEVNTPKNEIKSESKQPERERSHEPSKQTTKQQVSVGASTTAESHQQMQKINDMIRSIANIDPSLKCLETTKFSDFKAKVQTMIKASKAKGLGEGSSSSPKMEPIFKTLTDEIKGLQIHVSVYDQFLHDLTSCYSQVVVHLTAQTRRLEAEHAERLNRIEEILLRFEHPERMQQIKAAVTTVKTFVVLIFGMIGNSWQSFLRWVLKRALPQLRNVLSVSKEWLVEVALPTVRQKFETNHSWRDAVLFFSGVFISCALSPVIKVISMWTMSRQQKVKDEGRLPPYTGKVARSKKKKKAKRKVHQVTSDDDDSSL